MGVLDTYNNADFGKNSAFGSGGSSGGGGGGGSTGRKRFTLRGYTATVNDKLWSVSFDGVVVVSDVNNNTSSVNEQLARDWIENEIKRKEAMQTGNTTPSGYSSWRRVVDAYRQGLLSYDEAYNILITQFNYTPNIARATLGASSIEDTEFDDDTLTPKPEEEKEIIPLTDNQRFLIIGIVVTAGLYGFIKR
tara:strand:- start:116 stop:691 length:576 start_codon:yes stop_codon:yes gene_type:complete